MILNNIFLEKVFGHSFPAFSADGIGVVSSVEKDFFLTYLGNAKYLKDLNSNEKIKAVFVEKENEKSVRKGIVAIVVDDPVWYFSSLLNYLAENKEREKTVIHSSAKIHPSAVIADYGVVVGEGTIIEPNVTIYSDVEIGNHVLVRAGAVIGCDGFEHKRTSRGIVSVVHDGKVIIKNKAEIGVNSNINKGFSYRNTVVGEETKIDALVHYAHGAQCGKRCMIVASAMVAGHVTLGDDVWVGPSSAVVNRINIDDQAFISMGAVVVKSVGAGEQVTGNFAIPHALFIRNLKNSVK